MKRLKLWIRELSLSQQLLSIIFVVITVFSVFCMVFLAESINNFVQLQMFGILDKIQPTIAYTYNESPEKLEDFMNQNDASLTHVIVQDGKITMQNNSELFDKESLVSLIESSKGQTQSGNHFVYNEGKRLYYFSVMRMDDGAVLISIVSDTYRTEFKEAVLNSVVNFNVIVVGVLFIMLMLWISSLIHPLNQIRAYIVKIKNGEEAELKIKRKDEIGEVAEVLVAMQKELSQQNQIKEEMIQNISHDLKTPIATIKSYGESIKDGIYPYDTLEKSVDVIIENAERLEKKVHSLIVLNKMGYLNDTLEEGNNLDMVEVIEKAILSLKVIRPELRMNTDLEYEFFHGEEEPWRIVVENILDNAIRYAKTEITIELRKDSLAISNDGPQMSKERLEKMFKPYEKGTDGKFGLGMSIVYKVCNTYGYRVVAENLSSGVVFRITKK